MRMDQRGVTDTCGDGLIGVRRVSCVAAVPGDSRHRRHTKEAARQRYLCSSGLPSGPVTFANCAISRSTTGWGSGA